MSPGVVKSGSSRALRRVSTMAGRALLMACVAAAVAPAAQFAPCGARVPRGNVRPSALGRTRPPLFGGCGRRPGGSPRPALERSGDKVEADAPGQRGLLQRWRRAWSTRGVTADGQAVPSGETLSEVSGRVAKCVHTLPRDCAGAMGHHTVCACCALLGLGGPWLRAATERAKVGVENGVGGVQGRHSLAAPV